MNRPVWKDRASSITNQESFATCFSLKTLFHLWKHSRFPFLQFLCCNDFHCLNFRYNPFLIGKINWFILRLFETHPNIQDTFPSFKGVSLDELMNSRSLYLHAKRVMAAVESTISALDDAEVLVESLTNLGRRHRPWSIREEHFKVLKEQMINLGLSEMIMAPLEL